MLDSRLSLDVCRLATIGPHLSVLNPALELE